MFNKPNIFGRSEPITRKENTSVLGAARKPASPPAETIATLSAQATRQGTTPPSTGAQQAAVAAPVALPEAVVPGVARESAANENIMGARLIVGPEVKLKGAEILDCDTLVVEGRVEATMDSRVIRIAENGSFAGTVSIDIAEIHGTFEGELTARSQLIIHSTGRVSGKIRYGKLLADEGGVLCGDINTLSDAYPKKNKEISEPLLTLSVAAG